MDDHRVGVGKSLGFSRTTPNQALEAQCCWVRPGSRGLLVTGAIGEITKASATGAYDLVLSHIDAVRRAVGMGTAEPLDLIKAGTDIHLHILFGPMEGDGHALCKAAMVVAMISLLAKRRTREDTAIIGDVTCIGALGIIVDGGWTVSMVQDCFNQGIRRMVISIVQPLSDHPEVKARAAEIAPDGQPTLTFLQHRFVWDAMPDLFQ